MTARLFASPNEEPIAKRKIWTRKELHFSETMGRITELASRRSAIAEVVRGRKPAREGGRMQNFPNEAGRQTFLVSTPAGRPTIALVYPSSKVRISGT